MGQLPRQNDGAVLGISFFGMPLHLFFRASNQMEGHQLLPLLLRKGC